MLQMFLAADKKDKYQQQVIRILATKLMGLNVSHSLLFSHTVETVQNVENAQHLRDINLPD